MRLQLDSLRNLAYPMVLHRVVVLFAIYLDGLFDELPVCDCGSEC